MIKWRPVYVEGRTDDEYRVSIKRRGSGFDVHVTFPRSGFSFSTTETFSDAQQRAQRLIDEDKASFANI